MNDLEKISKFITDKKIYKNSTIKNVDYRKKDYKSFERCDFRGTIIDTVYFYNNSFDRADFISSFFKDVVFDGVNFGAPQFKNCIFDSVKFIGCKYNSAVFIDCLFKGCSFFDEHIFCNIINSTFQETKIESCKFERSSLDKNYFYNCLIKNVDFATMHAEDLQFKSTQFVNVLMDIEYVFTYLFDNSNDFKNIVLLDRGERIKHQINSINQIIEDLLNQERFYEVFNLFILYDMQERLIYVLKKLLNSVKKQNNALKSIYNINQIIDAMNFYIIENILDLDVFFSLLNLLKLHNFTPLDDFKKITIAEKIYILEQSILNINFSTYRLKKSCFKQRNINMIFSSVIENEKMAEEYLNNILDKISRAIDNQDKYTIIKKEKGSWIFTVSTSLIFGLVVIQQIQKIIVNSQKIISNHRTLNFVEKIQKMKIESEMYNFCVSAEKNEKHELDIKSINTSLQEINTSLNIDDVKKIIDIKFSLSDN